MASLVARTPGLDSERFYAPWSAVAENASSGWTVIGMHNQGHDNTVAIVKSGTVEVVLEVERLFGVRYFEFSHELIMYGPQLGLVVAALRRFWCSDSFDFGVLISSCCWGLPLRAADNEMLTKRWISAKLWMRANHHWSHSVGAFYDSGFIASLIVSYDGGGNDGTFVCWHASSQEVGSTNPLLRLSRIALPGTEPNLGDRYEQIGIQFIGDVNGSNPNSVAGKLMAFAALGVARSEWFPAMSDWYFHRLATAEYPWVSTNVARPEKDLAATAQATLETIALDSIEFAVRSMRGTALEELDGVVLTGGVALNVILNERIHRLLRLPIHVPTAPNDGTACSKPCWLDDRVDSQSLSL
jgi:carbamoyltransferase